MIFGGKSQKQKRNQNISLGKKLLILVLVIFAVFFVTRLADSYIKSRYYIYYSMMINRHKDNAGNIDHMKMFKSSLKSYFESLFVNYDGIKRININIDFKDYEEIRLLRQLALKNTVLGPETKKTFDSTIDYQGKKYPAKIRLKGDIADHLNHPKKWSFRVNVEGEDLLMGYSSFSIQKPATRNYQYEPVILAEVKDNGVLAKGYDFLEVYINGERIGIMALEEHYTKEILARNNRQEGVFVKLNESDVWRPERILSDDPVSYFIYTNGLIMPVETYSYLPFLEESAEIAVGLQRAFLQGLIKPSEIFDIELMGKAAASSWLWQNPHALMWRNMKFYFNPVTYKFEPVISDFLAAGEQDFRYFFFRDYLQTAHLIYKDEVMFDSFVKEANSLVERYQDPSYLEIQKEREDRFLHYIKKDKFLVPEILFDDVILDAKSNLDLLNNGEYFAERADVEKPRLTQDFYKKDTEWTSVLHSYVVNEGNEFEIELVNILPEKLYVNEVKLSVNDANVGIANYSDIKLPIILPRTNAVDGIGKIIKLPLKNLRADDEVKAVITAIPENQTRGYVSESRESYPLIYKNPIVPQTKEEILSRNKFLLNEGNIYRVKPGKWNVENFIKFPERAELEIEEGTELVFSENAGLLLRGLIRIEGTKNNPVILRAKNKQEGWKGITILKSNYWSNPDYDYYKYSKGEQDLRKNILRNVIIRDIRNSEYGSWKLEGGLNFYESDVVKENVIGF